LGRAAAARVEAVVVNEVKNGIGYLRDRLQKENFENFCILELDEILKLAPRSTRRCSE
jgi:hypothetical protein